MPMISGLMTLWTESFPNSCQAFIGINNLDRMKVNPLRDIISQTLTSSNGETSSLWPLFVRSTSTTFPPGFNTRKTSVTNPSWNCGSIYRNPNTICTKSTEFSLIGKPKRISAWIRHFARLNLSIPEETSSATTCLLTTDNGI